MHITMQKNIWEKVDNYRKVVTRKKNFQPHDYKIKHISKKLQKLKANKIKQNPQ